MKKPLILAMVILLFSSGAWFSYAAWRAHKNLVTLNVRNMEVRKVCRKIEWQTWETIHVHTNVTGLVTLNVRDMPLPQVLEIITEQTESHWNAIYPLYTTKQSLRTLEQLALGDRTATNGWSAFQARGFGFRGGGAFGNNARAENDLVSLKLLDKDLETATMALGRFAQARVLPEDGTAGTVYLSLSQSPMSDAVAQLAKQVKRRWTRFYTLQRGFGAQLARRDGNVESDSSNASADGPRGGGQRFQPTPEMREQRQKQFEAMLETMTPEERARAEERRKQWEEMRSLTPEQRQQRLAAMGNDAAMQERASNRMLNGIKNTTPEQRVERDQQRIQRQQQRQQQQQAGGK